MLDCLSAAHPATAVLHGLSFYTFCKNVLEGGVSIQEIRGRKDWLSQPLRAFLRYTKYQPMNWRARLGAAQQELDMYERRLLVFKEGFGMANGKKKEAWMTEWIHVEMTSDMKARLAAWDIHDADILTLLSEYVAGEYKLGVTFNQANQTFGASLICVVEKATNSGLGVTGYAKTLYDALRVVLYKASVVLPEEWAQYDSGDSDGIG